MASYSNFGVMDLHKMALLCFPEFNQSITLSILYYLPPELPPYDFEKLENKTAVPLQDIVAEIVTVLLRL